MPLVVDEAWGAHLHFHPSLPADALASGADLVTSSTHKIVGSLTQAAMLHLGEGDRIDPAVVDRCVSLVETTSPSGLLSGSLDAARRQAQVHGAELLGETLGGDRRDTRGIERDPRASRCSTRAWSAGRGSPAGTRCGSRSTCAEPAPPATAWRKPPSTRAASTSSSTRRTSSSPSSASASPPPRPASGWSAALRDAVAGLEGEPGPPDEKLAPPPPWGELAMTPREAFLGPQEVIPFEQAAGRVAAEGLAAYPPGIPNVLPGERLTAETLDFIRESVAHGGYVRGGSDRELKTLRVAL